MPDKVRTISRRTYGTLPAIGNVTGSFKQIGGDCAGDYSLSGKFSDNQFALRTGAGGKQGCGNAGVKLATKGGKLVGTYSKYELELSK
jgi:hypothetical protein